jgi:hypothetical protein
MNTKNELKEETIKVPADMLIDILTIIFKERLKYEILQIIENRAIAVIMIGVDENPSRQVKVIQNIHNLLSTYNDYRFGQDESLNWRES